MMTDVVLEKLSMTLPMGLGRSHARAIAALMDREARTCLDVGCGRGSFNSLAELQSVGCDIYPPNLGIAKEKGYYADVLQCDVRRLPFAAGSFDVALCLEVIEHLEKVEGLELLRRLEEIARRQVIVTTPWGYYPLEERHDNPALNHVSGWLPDEFTARGYDVYPFYYPRYPTGNRTHQVIGRYLLSPVLYPVVRSNPAKWALDFVAVKRVG